MLLVLTVIASAPANQAEATHPGTNGPLLVSGQQGFGLLPASGVGFVPLDRRGGGWDAEFSSNGSRVAFSAYEANTGIVRVQSAGGGVVDVARIPGYHLESLSWSPDSSMIAIAATQANGTGSRIYRVNSSGSGLTLIRDLGNNPGGIHLDWHPTANKIALVWGVDVWTIDSAGGSLTQWTNECSYDTPLRGSGEGLCDVDGDFVSNEYSDSVSWSPSGASLLVGMSRHCVLNPCPSTASLASLKVGSKVGTPVTTWPTVPGEDYYSELNPISSPDGKQYAYQGGDGEILVGSFAGGAPKRVIGGSAWYWKVLDWQPCPNGVCASYVAGKPTTTSLSYQVGGTCDATGCGATGLVATGSVRPAQKAGLSVTALLEVLRNGRWSRVSLSQLKLNAASDYRVSWKPKRLLGAQKCRITVTFPGTTGYQGSRATKTFRC